VDCVGAPDFSRGPLPVKGWLTEKIGKPKLDKLDLNRLHGTATEIQAIILLNVLPLLPLVAACCPCCFRTAAAAQRVV
jgi:hypothetical protein